MILSGTATKRIRTGLCILIKEFNQKGCTGVQPNLQALQIPSH